MDFVVGAPSDRSPDSQEPRWVATGPLLPLGMFIATLIAALAGTPARLSWTAVALCLIATLILVVRAFRHRTSNRDED